jgi:hypothetical protein
VVVDRQAVARAGVSYVALDDGRVQLVSRGRRGDVGVGMQGPLGIRAFLDLARQRRWTRSESTLTMMVLSGSEGRIGSLQGSLSTYGGHSRGPSLTVVPTVLPGGRVRLRVSTGIEDRAETVWGARDASPAWTETEIVARDGEEVTVASSIVSESSRSGGLLRVSSGDLQRDVLIVLTPTVVP